MNLPSQVGTNTLRSANRMTIPTSLRLLRWSWECPDQTRWVRTGTRQRECFRTNTAKGWMLRPPTPAEYVRKEEKSACGILRVSRV